MPKGKGYDYRQSKRDRMDESRGMRDYQHGYKEGMMGKVMGHEKDPKKVNSFAAQKRDLNRVDMKPMDYRGTPEQAFDYKY